MSEPEQAGEPVGVEYLRARVHRISDLAQAHEGKIAEHAVILRQHERQLDSIEGRMATREQLTGAVTGMSERMDRFHGENTLKLQVVDTKLDALKTAMKEAIDPIRSGVNRVVFLIIAAVIAAVLGLVLGKPAPLPAAPVLSSAPFAVPTGH